MEAITSSAESNVPNENALKMETSPTSQNVPTKKKRNRLTNAQREALYASIRSDLEAGHPFEAIMLRNGLSMEQLKDAIMCLAREGHFHPVQPKYKIASVNERLGKYLVGCEYAKVQRENERVVFIPYNPNMENEHE